MINTKLLDIIGKRQKSNIAHVPRNLRDYQERLDKEIYEDFKVLGSYIDRKFAQTLRKILPQKKSVCYVVNTNTGETGFTRTYDFSFIKAGHAVVATVCEPGTAQAHVVAASCTTGQVSLKFSIDPGTDQKATIVLTSPDKDLS